MEEIVSLLGVSFVGIFIFYLVFFEMNRPPESEYTAEKYSLLENVQQVVNDTKLTAVPIEKFAVRYR